MKLSGNGSYRPPGPFETLQDPNNLRKTFFLENRHSKYPEKDNDYLNLSVIAGGRLNMLRPNSTWDNM